MSTTHSSNTGTPQPHKPHSGPAPAFPVRSSRRTSLHIPARGNSTPPITALDTPAPPVLPPKETVDIPGDLAAERTRHGFDDIPVEAQASSQSSFRQLFGAWLRQAISHSPLEEKQQRLSHRLKNRDFFAWKDDLRWALKADLMDDEPETRSSNQLSGHSSKTPVAQQHAAAVHFPHPPMARPTHKTIDININLPKLRTPPIKKLFQHRFSRRIGLIVGLAVITIVAVGGGYRFLNPTPASQTGSTPSALKTVTRPDYPVVTPANKTITQWSRISPPGKNPVFAYSDNIGSVQISVSQQPLPKEFANDTDSKIEKFATNYSATKQIKTNDTTIYLGTSSEGPQSAILTKNDLLILIKSTQNISSDQWSTYVNSLQ